MADRDHTPARPMPTFTGYCNDVFGRGWVMTRAGPVTPAEFRRAKRNYEAMVGCRAFSPEYMAMFYGEDQA